MSLEEAPPQRVPLDVSGPSSMSPMAELLRIAGPTLAQMTSYTAMQFVDTLMIADYGIKRDTLLPPIAAANGGFASFAVVCVGFGTVTIVNALASQCYGGKRYRRCGRFMWQGIWFALAFSALIVPLMFVGAPIFRFAGHSPELVLTEEPYFRILLYATVFRMVGAAVGQFLIAVDKAVWPLLASLLGIGANVVLNWLLIFGTFGFPELGVAGAAWATNFAAVIELLVVGAVVVRPAMRRFGVDDWRLRMPAMRRLLKIGLPSGFQFAADVWPWSVFLGVIMVPFGEAAMAANLFMFRFMITSFLPAVGIAVAVTALVGRYVGARDITTAKQRAQLGFKVVMGWIVFVGIIYFCFPRPLMMLFTDDPEVLRLGTMLLMIAAGYQFFDAMYITYAHALRGAGDTLVPAVVTATLCWGMLIGGGSLMVWLVPQWGVFGPWGIACVYGVVLGFYMVWRFHYGKWQRQRPAGFEVIPAGDRMAHPAGEASSVPASRPDRQAMPALQETS